MHSSDRLQSGCMALCSFVLRLIQAVVSSVELQEHHPFSLMTVMFIASVSDDLVMSPVSVLVQEHP